MKRIIYLVILTFFSSIIVAKNFETGIWTGYDCEVVRTERYCIVFAKEKDNVISKCYSFEQRNGQIYCDFIGKIKFSDSLIISKELNYNLDSTISQDEIGINTEKGLSVLVNGKVRTLTKIENLEIIEPYKMPYAKESNIGKCLQEWQLGTRFLENAEKGTVKLTIETNRHSYVFSVMSTNIYCRAARIRSNNNGTLFAQNVRQWHDQKNHTTYFIEKNDSISSSDLTIDNSLFKPDACVFDKAGIYWSLTDFSKRKIKLNGCGATYTYFYVPKKSNGRKEWFKYEEY